MDGQPLRKMFATASDGAAGGTVEYALGMCGNKLPMAGVIGGPFMLRFTGVRSCTRCGRRVRKLFADGLCWPCFRDAPEASPCIIRPELCRAHLGEGRDVQWEVEHHFREHVVYLAFTGGVKVGVTRATQVPVRWIDQGAVLAVPIARMPYRQLAGAIECELKLHFPDRTNWRRMLRPNRIGEDVLAEARERALEKVSPELQPYLLAEEAMVRLEYPLPPAPPRLAAVKLEQAPEVAGRLLGIKGQYLVWADGRVLNVRNHSGWHVEVEA